MRKGIAVLLLVIQTVLWAAHFFVYETWIYFWQPAGAGWMGWRSAAVVLAAMSFVAASLLSFKFWNCMTRVFYSAAAIWRGLFNFFFLVIVCTLVSAVVGL